VLLKKEVGKREQKYRTKRWQTPSKSGDEIKV
jgi:hypothetical protein